MKTIIRKTARIRLLAAVAALGLTGAMLGMAASAPAGAATTAAHQAMTASANTKVAFPSCPSGGLCGWTGAGYTGHRAVLYQNNTSLPGFWQHIDSIYNDNASLCPNHRTYQNVWIYRGTHYNSEGGHVAEIHPGTGFPNMHSQLPGLYHNVRSNHWCTPRQ